MSHTKELIEETLDKLESILKNSIQKNIYQPSNSQLQ